MDDPVPETNLYSDDVRLIADMIREEWSLGPGNEVNIEYMPESTMGTARVGQVYTYLISRNNRISTTDYRTLERHTRIGIRVSNRFRENHYLWCDEIYRILMANRRCGQKRLNRYTFLEVTGDRMFNDLQGWYTTTIDIELTSYNVPIRSAGFGDEINRRIAERDCDL